jgi:hypothetical protein
MSKFNGLPDQRDVGRRSIEFALTVPARASPAITGVKLDKEPIALSAPRAGEWTIASSAYVATGH